MQHTKKNYGFWFDISFNESCHTNISIMTEIIELK